MNQRVLTAGQSTGPLVTKHASHKIPDSCDNLCFPNGLFPILELLLLVLLGHSDILSVRAQVPQHSTDCANTIHLIPVLHPSLYKLANGISSLLVRTWGEINPSPLVQRIVDRWVD